MRIALVLAAACLSLSCGEAKKVTLETTPLDLLLDCTNDSVAATVAYREKRLRFTATAQAKDVVSNDEALITLGSLLRHVRLHDVPIEQAAKVRLNETEFVAHCDFWSCSPERVYLNHCNIAIP